MNILITRHAIERFVQRHAPDLSFDEARTHLAQAVQTANRLKERTVLGQQQWQLTDPECVLVVKNDPRAGAVVVTVLSAPDRPRGSLTPGEEEIVREWLESLPKVAPLAVTVERAQAVQKASEPKPLKPSQLQITAKRPKARQYQFEQIEAAKKKQEERTKRHNAERETKMACLSAALRASVRYLILRASGGDADAREILELVQEIEPAFVGSAFIKG